MVNILKHRKINKNPFVKYLKNFNENEGFIKALEGTSGRIEHFLGNGRSIRIEEDSLFLINYEYYSLGCFKIPIEELKYTSGNFYFITNANDSDLKTDVGIFFSSKKELYEVINEIDSIENESKLKELLLIFQEIGFRRNSIRKYSG